MTITADYTQQTPGAFTPRMVAFALAAALLAVVPSTAAWAGSDGSEKTEMHGQMHNSEMQGKMHNSEMKHEGKDKGHGKHPEMHKMHMKHKMARMGHRGANMSAGQEAFGTMREIVAMLKADPGTDWSKVDIDGLREHLVDMDRVTMDAMTTVTEIPGGAYFDVSGTGRTLKAIRAMVPAHAPQLDMIEGWNASASTIFDGIRLSVTSDDPAQTAIIRGLGFYGLMVTGDHHGPHHLGMAKGEMVHNAM